MGIYNNKLSNSNVVPLQQKQMCMSRSNELHQVRHGRNAPNAILSIAIVCFKVLLKVVLLQLLRK